MILQHYLIYYLCRTGIIIILINQIRKLRFNSLSVVDLRSISGGVDFFYALHICQLRVVVDILLMSVSF